MIQNVENVEINGVVVSRKIRRLFPYDFQNEQNDIVQNEQFHFDRNE